MKLNFPKEIVYFKIFQHKTSGVQTIATFERSHIAILVGTTCYTHLATGPCCDMLARLFEKPIRCWLSLKMVEFFMQYFWVLHGVVIVWPGSGDDVVRLGILNQQ